MFVVIEAHLGHNKTNSDSILRKYYFYYVKYNNMKMT